MKQVFVKKGSINVDDVPAPLVGDNSIIVQVVRSCISAGTEVSTIVSSDESLLQKVIKNRGKIVKLITNLNREGIKATIHKVQAKLNSGCPVGYSAAGIVLEVGKNIADIQAGDRVACAGAGIANHAEYIEVPRNLIVRIPEELGFNDAATVTLGAIAMQGMRRADVNLGEYLAVIGLGILGQITVQLLKTAGCHVIGIDLDERRIQRAIELGMEKGMNAGIDDPVEQAIAFSNGFGVDAVIITAATNSPKPLAQAFQMCRKKGRVVLVGVVGMEIDREDMYKKELDFRISTSYGPGRYDEEYEQRGISYPYAYVRWTETRNMEEYLNLIARKKINVTALIEGEYLIGDSAGAYEALRKGENRPLIVLLKYDAEKEQRIIRKIEINAEIIRRKGAINVAIIGAGGFATGVHLPNLRRLSEFYTIYAIASRTGNKAQDIARNYGAKYGTTDYREVLADKDVDAVIIATRHNLHAAMAIESLRAGKGVFLEKPMALNQEELDELVKTIEETRKPFMVGFNRRFSPYAQEVKKYISKRINPMIVNYQVNAGYIPLDHWVHNEEGGGRIIGEACHIFDLFNFFTEAGVESVSSEKIAPKTRYFSVQDNVVNTLKYADGSICNLVYTALGNRGFPKETCHIYFEGKIIVIDDYRKLIGYGLHLQAINSHEPEKGQYQELKEFYKYLKGEREQPIPLWQMVQATQISFVTERG